MNIIEAMSHAKETGSVMRSKSTGKEFWYCEDCEIFLFPDHILATDWQPKKTDKRRAVVIAAAARLKHCRPNPSRKSKPR